jgi:NifU-like protein involved in Fe-S cluster formation
MLSLTTRKSRTILSTALDRCDSKADTITTNATENQMEIVIAPQTAEVATEIAVEADGCASLAELTSLELSLVGGGQASMAFY